jgi:hypothetical protein
MKIFLKKSIKPLLVMAITVSLANIDKGKDATLKLNPATRDYKIESAKDVKRDENRILYPSLDALY